MGSRPGSGYPHLREPCAEARSLSELPPDPRDAVRCDYSLGQRMFFSLYRVLGEEAFYEATRRLYDQSRADVAQKSLDGTPSGVGAVHEAFGVEGDVAVDRWYDGKGDYRVERFLAQSLRPPMDVRNERGTTPFSWFWTSVASRMERKPASER